MSPLLLKLKEKKLKLELAVIVAVLLTAIRMRLFVAGAVVSIIRIHFPERRSNRTWGSVRPLPPETEAQNAVSVEFSAPRFPALS